MDNGKEISVKVMELTIIQIVTALKEIGIMISKMESVHTIIPMETFIRVNGLMGNLMVRAIIFIMEIKVFTRVTGKMVRKKDLENLSLKTNTDIQANGKKIKKMEEGLIYIQMEKSMKVVG